MEDRLLTSGLRSTNKDVKQLSAQEALAALFDEYCKANIIAFGDSLGCLIERKICSFTTIIFEFPVALPEESCTASERCKFTYFKFTHQNLLQNELPSAKIKECKLRAGLKGNFLRNMMIYGFLLFAHKYNFKLSQSNTRCHFLPISQKMLAAKWLRCLF